MIGIIALVSAFGAIGVTLAVLQACLRQEARLEAQAAELLHLRCEQQRTALRMTNELTEVWLALSAQLTMELEGLDPSAHPHARVN